MQYLFDRHQSMLRTVENLKSRPLSEHIAWENPFNALLGSRGVGKTTLLLQRIIQLGLPPHESLYIELGDLYFQEYRLQDFIRQFVEGGGKYLFIDEVHRYGYGSWAQEIKQAYDLYHRELKLTFTGSSAIRILKEKADLSRRVLQHRIPGLSFREYLWLSEKKTLPILSLKEILNDHDKLANELIGDYKLKPIAKLSDYYKFGYYPIYLHEPQGYLAKLNSMIELVLEADLPKVIDQGTAPYQALGRLLFAIASSAPFTPNTSKLASRLGINRATLVRYLDILDRADLTISLRKAGKGVSTLAKPDKLYLNNTNLLYALSPHSSNLGTLRETFFLNQLRYLTYENHLLPPEVRLPKKGDFLLQTRSNDFLFEVGGRNKTLTQIGEEEHHYAVVDREFSHQKNRIPLWLFGMLY